MQRGSKWNSWQCCKRLQRARGTCLFPRGTFCGTSSGDFLRKIQPIYKELDRDYRCEAAMTCTVALVPLLREWLL